LREEFYDEARGLVNAITRELSRCPDGPTRECPLLSTRGPFDRFEICRGLLKRLASATRPTG